MSGYWRFAMRRFFLMECSFMDRDELIHLIHQGPVRVRMNNGDVWEIPSAEFAIVGDLHAAVLVRDDDGIRRAKILSLVCMCSAEPMERTS